MKKENKKFQKISDLKEFALIEHLTKNFKSKNRTTIKSIGDDAAVLNYENKEILVTTDLLTEGIHFDLTYVPLIHLGYKSVIVNLSDIYAMNGTPKQITVAIAISKKISLKAIEEFYKGIYLACEKYNVDLIGGDTSSSLTGMQISITAIGEIDISKISYRNSAKKNDLICVSGNLGASYFGLLLLEREKQVLKENPYERIDLNEYKYILQRQLRPEARRDIIESLEKMKIKPNSMIDISDGLSSEILHICKNSEVGCKIFEEKIPIAFETKKIAEIFKIHTTTAALNGGEDYEMLFTISQKDFEKINKISDVSIIGYITDKKDGKKLITNTNEEIDLKAQGWTM
ncbi:MAG: thiamine-phosphate kinase [Bacteroidetes bacterium 4572_128]|nr:MAG: thiamine-phosphate kinase [Bacteroidetes bacterium 4572_128]